MSILAIEDQQPGRDSDDTNATSVKHLGPTGPRHDTHYGSDALELIVEDALESAAEKIVETAIAGLAGHAVGHALGAGFTSIGALYEIYKMSDWMAGMSDVDHLTLETLGVQDKHPIKLCETFSAVAEQEQELYEEAIRAVSKAVLGFQAKGFDKSSRAEQELQAITFLRTVAQRFNGRHERRPGDDERRLRCFIAVFLRADVQGFQRRALFESAADAMAADPIYQISVETTHSLLRAHLLQGDADESGCCAWDEAFWSKALLQTDWQCRAAPPKCDKGGFLRDRVCNGKSCVTPSRGGPSVQQLYNFAVRLANDPA